MITVKGEFMKDSLKTIATFFIAFAVIVAIVVGCAYIEIKQNERIWNNGVCPICGQKWELLNVNKISAGAHEYVYNCSNCNISIFLSFEQH